MSAEDGREWRYLNTHHGRGRSAKKHDLGGYGSVVTSRTPALCGIRPSTLQGWFGTGSQEEYEECERRVACRNCVTELHRNRSRGI